MLSRYNDVLSLYRIECMDVENSLPLPNLLESSDLLSTKHLRKVSLHWTLSDILTPLIYSWR